LEYTRFQTNEPNGGVYENCMVMVTENGNWGDFTCTNAISTHVCEKPVSGPNPVVKEGNSINDSNALFQYYDSSSSLDVIELLNIVNIDFIKCINNTMQLKANIFNIQY